MRITYIGPLPPDTSGIAQHGSRLVEALQIEHEVDTASWKSMYPSLLYPGTANSADSTSGRSLTWWNPISWYRTGRKARDSDLVVIPYVHPFLAVATGFILRAAGSTSTAVIVHNAEPHETFPASRGLMRWCLKGADRIVAHSDHVAATVSKWLPSASLAVVPHPPNALLTPTPPPRMPPLRLLFLGYVRPYKGLDLCLEALALAAGGGVTNLRLTVAGEFWEEVSKYEGLVGDFSLHELVTFKPGYVPEDRLGELIGEHHALVLPYRSATQSGLVPLAFAAGRPVVVTNVGGLAEQVLDGVNGVVANGTTAEALAASLEELVTNYSTLQPRAESSTPKWAAVADAVVGPGR